METASSARMHLPGETTGDEPVSDELVAGESVSGDEAGARPAPPLPPAPAVTPISQPPPDQPSVDQPPVDQTRPPVPVPAVPVPSLEIDPDPAPDIDPDPDPRPAPPLADTRAQSWPTRVTPLPPAAAAGNPSAGVVRQHPRVGNARVITGSTSEPEAQPVNDPVARVAVFTGAPAAPPAPPAPPVAPPTPVITGQPEAPTVEQLPTEPAGPSAARALEPPPTIEPPPPSAPPPTIEPPPPSAPLPTIEPSGAPPTGRLAAPVKESPATGPVADTVTGFAPSVSAKLKSYVYLLVDPRTGRAFCVGRGRNDRCFRHVRAARAGSGGVPGRASDPDSGDSPGPGSGAGSASSSKYPMLEKIREVEAGGRSVRIDILRYGMSPEEALLVEGAVHEALGFSGPPEAGEQRQSAEEASSHLAKRAKFKRVHQVVLLRVGAKGSDPSYQSARHGWRIGKRWIDLESPRSPKWAVIVVGEVVAAVHRIDGWEPAPLRGRSRHSAVDTTARSTYRYSFTGAPDPELERRYVGKSVAGYLGTGTPSPVTYVWSGPHWVNAG
jgi:hypothetical protein